MIVLWKKSLTVTSDTYDTVHSYSMITYDSSQAKFRRIHSSEEFLSLLYDTVCVVLCVFSGYNRYSSWSEIVNFTAMWICHVSSECLPSTAWSLQDVL